MTPPECGQELSKGYSHGGAEGEPHGHVHVLTEAAAGDAAAADAEAPPDGLQVVVDVLPADGERRAGGRVEQRRHDGAEEQHGEHPP